MSLEYRAVNWAIVSSINSLLFPLSSYNSLKLVHLPSMFMCSSSFSEMRLRWVTMTTYSYGLCPLRQNRRHESTLSGDLEVPWQEKNKPIVFTASWPPFQIRSWKNPCPYHAIILAKRGEIDDTWLNTSREVHAYLIEKSLQDSGHGHRTIRPHSPWATFYL